ncbi:MAG: 2-amino-4-hydroxy-6-hydroxymethyldihydropteridine diphosphokinase [Bacteroidales bacterium]|jgi:2-amino-4-hydroxy-6-hydroxymethyldihydropteridine diphosphokinase|nr:2-amino-4-hydroxy-6-hydroxymethyldihydropteridine diphosphokinase [Bacteroidales bacterium]MDD4213182.1 2-amino-4-hydroxy-6-hydroxymethyldihydropteridine diphosphokinase [Bacteroidales bacterium]
MICFSLGSNSGDRFAYLRSAVDRLIKAFGRPASVSSVYETEPWGVKGHNNYLNAVICFETEMTARNIHKRIAVIENIFGRVRMPGKIHPRTIDIDILFYNDEIIHTPTLTIPHPRLHLRKFVLMPLSEILNDFIHPETGISVREMLEKCEDKCCVVKTDFNLFLH